MAEINEIYKCSVCGNVVEVTFGSAGQLVCCGKPMELMAEKTQDEGNEKHVPVAENVEGNQFRIKVGAEPHPMEEAHYIQWIEVLKDDGLIRKHLKPGDAPEKEFAIQRSPVKLRCFCNIHGLWAAEK